MNKMVEELNRPWKLRLVLKDGTVEESTTHFLSGPTVAYVRPTEGGGQQWFWMDVLASNAVGGLVVYREGESP